jgi:hypothetical protein
VTNLKVPYDFKVKFQPNLTFCLRLFSNGDNINFDYKREAKILGKKLMCFVKVNAYKETALRLCVCVSLYYPSALAPNVEVDMNSQVESEKASNQSNPNRYV